MTFVSKKDTPGPVDDEELWDLMARLGAKRDLERKAQDRLGENEQPVFKAGMSYDQFLAGLTMIWNCAPAVFWNIHRVVLEANPQWQPPQDGEGNVWTPGSWNCTTTWTRLRPQGGRTGPLRPHRLSGGYRLWKAWVVSPVELLGWPAVLLERFQVCDIVEKQRNLPVASDVS